MTIASMACRAAAAGGDLILNMADNNAIYSRLWSIYVPSYVSMSKANHRAYFLFKLNGDIAWGYDSGSGYNEVEIVGRWLKAGKSVPNLNRFSPNRVVTSVSSSVLSMGNTDISGGFSMGFKVATTETSVSPTKNYYQFVDFTVTDLYTGQKLKTTCKPQQVLGTSGG